jgi:RNA polymerase sigma-70 factor, ECF subfamily
VGAGAPQAELFLQVVLPHLDMLHNLSRRLSASPEEAEDLVQDTFLRAWAAWPATQPSAMGPWLATICLNAARSAGRHRASRPLLRSDDSALAAAPADGDTAAEALGRVDAARVRAALARLRPEQREAIVLVDLCGLTSAEVARLVGAPRNTVLSRLHRGHKALAVLLGDQARAR